MLSALSLQKRPASRWREKAYDYIDVSKIVPHKQILCSIPFRKDLQAEAERKKQNRKDSDPPGEISNRWATCSDESIYSTNLLHTILYIIFTQYLGCIASLSILICLLHGWNGT